MKSKTKITNINLTFLMKIFVILFALFAFKRIKYSIDLGNSGFSLSIEVVLYLVVIVLIFLLQIASGKINLSKSRKILILLYFLILVSSLGVSKVVDLYQYFYATLIFFVPLLFLFSFSHEERKYHVLFANIIILIGIIYSLLAIFSSLNYGLLMSFLGNNVQDQYFSQYRASLMIGSSITVSNFLNILLPLNFHMFFGGLSLKPSTKEKKFLYMIALILNIVATLILQSRLSFIITIGLTIYYTLFFKKYSVKFKTRFIALVLFIIAFLYLSTNLNLAHLFIGFSNSDLSIISRLSSMNLGIRIFSDNIMFGSGFGRYFVRIFDGNILTYGQYSGLVDPHNAYILILSETGLFGFLIIMMIFFVLVKDFLKIRENSLKNLSIITLITSLLISVGGSHIINEISFSTFFWIYISFFLTFPRIKDNSNLEVKK